MLPAACLFACQLVSYHLLLVASAQAHSCIELTLDCWSVRVVARVPWIRILYPGWRRCLSSGCASWKKESQAQVQVRDCSYQRAKVNILKLAGGNCLDNSHQLAIVFSLLRPLHRPLLHLLSLLLLLSPLRLLLSFYGTKLKPQSQHSSSQAQSPLCSRP